MAEEKEQRLETKSQAPPCRQCCHLPRSLPDGDGGASCVTRPVPGTGCRDELERLLVGEGTARIGWRLGLEKGPPTRSGGSGRCRRPWPPSSLGSLGYVVKGQGKLRRCPIPWALEGAPARSWELSEASVAHFRAGRSGAPLPGLRRGSRAEGQAWSQGGHGHLCHAGTQVRGQAGRHHGNEAGRPTRGAVKEDEGSEAERQAHVESGTTEPPCPLAQ